ncbi:allantoate amidohydrolase [Bradyrhizobium genosp. SA-3]|uniref:allantoate amidohydrolase n=1 Tax=Bradyrhizobium genosp. SA-3 TaxID=508868 RepID=UPI001029042C|nr:allantoate amidohydrolase [Bradyrhizobium genosp. SA-3]RZN10431.1 allantoate amidohydrolase [Bradyrhizobium genosp. SA-3]
MRRLDELAEFSSEANALTRLYLSPEYKAAALQVMAWMSEAGMTTMIDAVGNVVGRYDGQVPDKPALLLGSHIDTVRNAGKYDGNLGVLVAIAAVAELNRAGERLPFPIEVIAFGNEEGVRFPVALTGSRTVAGTLDPAELDAEDEQGISVRVALQHFGCNPFDIPSIPRRRDDVLVYVEIHIEQGPVLESEELPVGVVTAINGAGRFEIDVGGHAGHAGTVPMGLRKDALAAASEMILAIERRAAGTPNLVATVGRIEVQPSAVNVIPERACFTMDIRAPADADRVTATHDLERELRAIAVRRGVALEMKQTYEAAAATCAPWLIEQLAASITRAGIKVLRLPSGAGHDGLAMTALCPIGMVFVRCRGGISHNPAESITVEDADVALRVTLDFLRHLEPASAAHQDGDLR